MRCLTITALVLFALVALNPLDVTAKPPGGGGGGGGWSMGGYSHGYPGHYYPGRWYGNYYDYYTPATPYTVERPIIENPVYSGLPIKITNPLSTGVTLSYTLNGVVYSIPPGSSQQLTQDRAWVIRFSRGGTFGEARYGLEPGVYTFARTEHGWELFHGALPQTSVVPVPSNTLPPNPTPSTVMPGNPMPDPAPMPEPAR